MNEVRLEFESENELLDYAKDRMRGQHADLILWEFANYLRDYYKHHDENEWPNLEEIRDRLFEICSDYEYDVYGG